MTPRAAGLALAAAHVALVGLLGLKLLADRAQLPRAWARTMPYDPSLPIRGRYVQLRLEVPLDSSSNLALPGSTGMRLESRQGQLRGVPDHSASASAVVTDSSRGRARVALADPVAFFIPEHIPDPSVRLAGEELWAEVTLPRRGPPRPIRLAVMKDGVLTPLEIP